MQNIPTKNTGDTLTAAEFNDLPDELENTITSTGIVLSGADLTQLVQSVSVYAAGGSFYTESGSSTAYVLGVIGAKVAPPAYFEGMSVSFIAINANSTATPTIEVAGLSVQNILAEGGGPLEVGDISSAGVTTLVYDGVNFTYDTAAARAPKSYKTVASMVADLGLLVGQDVSLTGYTTDGDGGAKTGTVVAGATGTDDGGSFHDLDNGNQFQITETASAISVLQFGARGDDSTDDSAAIQAAVDYVESLGWVKTNAEVGGGTFLGAKTTLEFPTRVFRIASTITMPSNYDNVDFGKCLLMPHGGFVQTNFALVIESWNTRIDRFRAAMFDNVVQISNANLNIGVVRFKDVQISGADVAFEITNRSSVTKIEDFRFDKVKIVAQIIDGDKVIFGDGWLSAGVFDNDKDAHFIMDSNTSPSLHIDHMLYVPEVQTATKCAIVSMGTSANDDPCRTYINNLLAGAEDGRIAIVNNFAIGDGTGRGSYINIENSSHFTAGQSCVRLFQLPNAVSFNNSSGGIDASHTVSLIDFDTEFRSFATAESEIPAGVSPELWFNGYTPANFENIPRAELSTLNKYIRSKNKTFRTYMQTVTTTPTNVTLPAAVRFTKGKAWKIKATNLANPAADRYTEVIVAGDFAGTTLTFVVIIQGVTSAPVFTQTAGVLEVASTAGSNDFAIEIEQLTDSTESFL